MNPTVSHPAGVSPESVHELVGNIWTSMLEFDVAAVPLDQLPVPRSAAEPLESVVGTVSICGGWNGWVELAGTTGLAALASAAMFQAPLDELQPGDVWDGWAELTNMVGGRIKALLPEPTMLSLPVVTMHGSGLRPGGPDGMATHFHSKGEAFTVRVVMAPSGRAGGR
jgi:chemotaxis protein CheX